MNKALVLSLLATTIIAENSWAGDYTPCSFGETNCWPCGATCVARLDGAGKMTISGSGAMDDYTSYDSGGNVWIPETPWADVRSNIISIEVEDGITHLGDRAFHTATNLSEVKLYEGLETIGLGTFYKNSSLESVSIPNSVVSLDEEAFNQAGLRTVDFGENSKLNSIGDFAFQLTNLTNVTIPNGVETIGEKAFFRTYAINNLVLPENLDSLGWESFGDSLLTTVIIPENATYIDRTAFSYTPLENVYCSEEQIQNRVCSSEKFYGVTPGYYTKNSDNTITLHKTDGSIETIANPWIKQVANKSYQCAARRYCTVAEANEATPDKDAKYTVKLTF